MRTLHICDGTELDKTVQVCRVEGLGIEAQSFFLPANFDNAGLVEKYRSTVADLAGISMHGPFGDLCAGSFDPKVRQVARDSVVVLTKTMARKPEKVTRDVERFLRELGTEVLDIVLLHYLSDSRWPKRFSGALEALSRARQAGKVRAVGVSCHSLGALKAALTSGWAEVVMARINARGIQTDAVPAKVVPVLAQLHAAGIGVVGMKVLGAGRLEAASAESIQYVFDLGTVQAITIGMTSRQQLGENIRTVISYT